MQPNFIPMLEPTPEPKKPLCRLLSRAIAVVLSFGSIIVALGVWYTYDLLFGTGALMASYLVIGIIRSKLRNSAVPRAQQEYPYTDKAIADWFVAKRLLCDM